MKKNKLLGVIIITLASILIILTAAYTFIFSKFGLMSGGSIFMLIPLWTIASVIIIGLSFMIRAGISYLKN